MEIRHNVYYDGNVQSVAYVVDGVVKMSTGIVLPREEAYDFGKIERREAIMVTDGELEINRIVYNHKNPTIIVEPGRSVVIRAREVAAYVCVYGD